MEKTEKEEQLKELLIQENSHLREELNKVIKLLARFPVRCLHGIHENCPARIEDDMQKQLTSVRNQGSGWGKEYATTLEKSHAASEYLIENAGKPLDFDAFHKEFQITMDKGGMLFPYDTLNWHTHLQLMYKGYHYKLFSVEDSNGQLISDVRYILVDKRDKIVWGSKFEMEGRVFNNEFLCYKGARYNSNFDIIKEDDK